MSELDPLWERVLAERGERYGAAVGEADRGAEVGTFVGCRAGDVVFGVPVSLVAEFAPLQRFTPLAGLRFVRGLTHLRGDVMALVDVFEAVTGMPTRLGQWMLVLEGRSSRAAVPVDEFLATRSVHEPELLPPERAPELMRGIAAATEDLWLLLDVATVRSLIDGNTR
jgi:chemotaxis signal transduction protein